MNGQAQAPEVRYLIPARTISGSRQEMVGEIDDVVRGLLGLRQLISMQHPGAGSRAPGGLWPEIRRWVRRLYGAASANR